MYILYGVLIFLKNYVIQANAVKCEWDYNSINYLEFVVMWYVIKPQPLKIKEIMLIEIPNKYVS